MNQQCHVTFIGGPADLTRRVMEINFARIAVPTFDGLATYHDANEPIRFQPRTAEYLMRRVSDTHWVAVFEGLR